MDNAPAREATRKRRHPRLHHSAAHALAKQGGLNTTIALVNTATLLGGRFL